MIQEYKERIKDCEAELKDKESALRDEKLISQKKQVGLIHNPEDYRNYKNNV